MRFHPFIRFIMIIYLFLTTSSFGYEDVKPEKEKPVEVLKENFEINAKKAVKFSVDAEVGPVNLTVVGENADLIGSVELVNKLASGKFRVDVTQFKTGLDKIGRAHV